MNKLFLSLLSASILALVLAIGCGAWLFLQSWEEGKRLERQNRELQASLEASRIRLENFCEYPVEALCNLEEPYGSVSSVMGGMENSAPLPEPSLPVPTAAADIHPATEFSAPLAVPVGENPPAHSDPAPLQEKTEPLKTEAPAATAPDSSKPLSPAAPLPQTPGMKETEELMMQEAGSISSATPSKSAPAAIAETVTTADKPQNVPPTLPKKTWITLNTDRKAMTLRIAGEGDSLEARGELLQNPLRYEVTLKGSWKVYNRHPSTRLVKGLKIQPSGENTLLVFDLNGTPRSCNVTQEDPRTIAISIR